MDFFIKIISERETPVLSLKNSDEASTMLAISLISVFADEMKMEGNLKVIGRTYQQKTAKLLSDLRRVIQAGGNNKTLWDFYGVFANMEEGEYFAFVTDNITAQEEDSIKDNILHLNHPDYEDLLKFKEDFCSGIVENYIFRRYENGRKQVRIGETDKSKMRCRFCGKGIQDVTFDKDAHTISEGLGNKKIITNDECDTCNENLGRDVEQDLMIYLSPLRTFMSIVGKHGKTKIKDDSFALYEDGPQSMHIDLLEQEEEYKKHWTFQHNGDEFKVSFTHPQMVNPQDVYRAVAKYAIGVMAESELPHFQETIQWIRGLKSAVDLPRLCFFLDNAPLNKEKPCITVFMRKTGDKSLPYSFIELQLSGVVIFAIIPFCDQDDRSFSGQNDWNHTMDVLKIYRKMPLLKVIMPNEDRSRRITYNFDFKKREEI